MSGWRFMLLIPTVGLCIAAADRPSGFDVWQTCREDIRIVCPGRGILNLGALKSCMRGNFSQLGPRCQTIIRRYQEGRPPDPITDSRFDSTTRRGRL